MQNISLIDLIAGTRESIKPFKHSQSMQWQFDYAWKRLCDYFAKHETTQFSDELANQYVMESRQRCEIGALAAWKFKLIRKTVSMLMQYYKYGTVKWAILPSWDKTSLKVPLYIRVSNDYVNQLESKGYGQGTIEVRKTVSNKFLGYLEQEGFCDLTELKLINVSRFVLYASKYYQPTSMGTLLSALRSFLAFAASVQLTATDLTRAIPKGFGRKTTIIPVITMKEEAKLLAAIDRKTILGKR